jgi:Coenzyme PQQ synthesis protein D (PqqD)
MSASRIPRRSLDVRARRVGATLLIGNQRQAVQLSTVAARVWTLMDGRRTVEDIALTVASEHRVEVATVQRDIAELLNDLGGIGLLDESAGTPHADTGRHGAQPRVGDRR